MTKSRANTRRKRGRRDQESSEANVWLDRIWRVGTRPAFVGALLFVSGLVLILGPASSLPDTPSKGWWVAALRFPDAIQASATMIVVAAAFAVGMAVHRFVGSRKVDERASRFSTIGAGLMGLGVFASLFVWFVAQADLPPSRVAIPNGQTIQSFPAIESGSSFKVMLPSRVKLVDVEPEASKATIELREAGEEEGVKNDVFVNDPLDVGGFRFALIGMEFAPAVRAAVLTKEGGIEARGTRGSKVRFEPDGPEYEVRQIATNYLGFMGPAVQLVTGEEKPFWVFQREQELENPLHDIVLRRIETAPVAVFSVATTPMYRYAGVAAIIFVLGLALFLLVSDRTGRSLAEFGPRLEGEQ